MLLKHSLDKLNQQFDAQSVVEIHPGKDHSTLMTRELVMRIRREMVQTFLAHRAEIESPLKTESR